MVNLVIHKVLSYSELQNMPLSDIYLIRTEFLERLSKGLL